MSYIITLNHYLQSYEQALGLYRQVGRSQRVRRPGTVARCQWQSSPSRAQAIALRREIHSLYDEGADYGNFALALLRVGARAKAKTYALQAKTVLQKIDEPSLLEWVERLIGACG